MLRVYVRHRATPPDATSDKPRPAWFDRGACFRNLRRTLGDAGVLTVVLDAGASDDDDPAAGFRDAMACDERIVVVRGGSDSASFRHTVDLAASEAADDDVVYLVEDDYLHVPGWPGVLLEQFRAGLADYATLYDHPDKYDPERYPGLAAQLMPAGGVHWRTTPSTTSTFATTGKSLRRDADVLHAFARELNHDHERFCALWERRGNAGVLVSAVPGLATHCELGLLGACVPWEVVE